jgi:integrase
VRRVRGAHDVRIFGIQDRSSRPESRKPRVARWKVDGKEHSRSFRTKAEADRFRSRLLVAQQDGERFDRPTGLPVLWLPQGADTQVHVWARRWVAEQWPEWQPRTRRGDVYSLARFIPLVTGPGAAEPPRAMRSYLCRTLPPDVDVDPDDPCERWLARWVLSLGDLEREVLADISRRMGIGDGGQPLANGTVRRYRRVAHSCVRRAVELGQIPADPWPPSPRGRSRRKMNRSRSAVDVRQLPSPDSVVAIIEAMRSHQPGSLTYQAMTAVVFYAGLRPSEVVMLRPRALDLPTEGWGSIAVTEADIDWGEPGDPKTGNRMVPIPPRLVELLRSWVNEHGLDDDELLFRTRVGGRPSESNWSRAA